MPSPSSLLAALPENWQVAGFGLYIHWPFCQAKCPYCDFNSHVVASIDQERWKRAYLAEIARVGAETEGRILTSVFFGGGTPSLMDPDTVAAILEAVAETWVPANDIEITLEANPTSVEAARFRSYRGAGVNRVSIGVQALNDADLKALGRLHSVEEAFAALEIARSTFDRVSFDLIYARQHQNLEDWRRELGEALALAPDHLSLYQLTIEDGTAFGDRFARGKLSGLPDEDLGADMYFLTQDMCEAAGLPAYEVSNHAKAGAESRHNLIYWHGGDYVGIGPGAHGRLCSGGLRYGTTTPVAPAMWLGQVEQAGSGEESRFVITKEEQASEYVLMSMRLAHGMDLDRYRKIAGKDINSNKINMLESVGLAETKGNRLCATAQGRPVLNAVIRELLSG